MFKRFFFRFIFRLKNCIFYSEIFQRINAHSVLLVNQLICFNDFFYILFEIVIISCYFFFFYGLPVHSYHRIPPPLPISRALIPSNDKTHLLSNNRIFQLTKNVYSVGIDRTVLNYNEVYFYRFFFSYTFFNSFKIVRNVYILIRSYCRYR